MTWHTTHLRSAALAEVERTARADPSAALPWRTSWAPLFGDRDGLAAAVRYRLRLRREAQLDDTEPAAVVRQRRTVLEARSGALAGMLARYDATHLPRTPAVGSEVARAS